MPRNRHPRYSNGALLQQSLEESEVTHILNMPHSPSSYHHWLECSMVIDGRSDREHTLTRHEIKSANNSSSYSQQQKQTSSVKVVIILWDSMEDSYHPPFSPYNILPPQQTLCPRQIAKTPVRENFITDTSLAFFVLVSK